MKSTVAHILLPVENKVDKLPARCDTARMAYEHTEVAVSKSQEAIRKLIYLHKGTGVILVSQPPREGFEAMVTISDTSYHIRIMATCKAFPSYTAPKIIEQEERRVWRVLYYHLKAMFESSDSGVIDVRDVIMPYVVMRDGRTLSDVVRPRMKEVMAMDTARLLGAGEQ